VEELAGRAVIVLLAALRIAPTLAFAPPFTLVRVPAVVRVALAIALAAWLIGPRDPVVPAGGLIAAAAAELLMGVALALSLQLAFAALYVAGRAIDIQSGFGLAAVVDPTTRAQTPLVGTLFAYAAGAVFFATNGPRDLLAVWSASFDRVPVGVFALDGGPAIIAAYLGAVFVMAFGLGGIVMVALFVADLAIALMSRTLPQMNVLLLGFQVKTLTLLALLPVAVALAGTLFLRLVRYALETAARIP